MYTCRWNTTCNTTRNTQEMLKKLRYSSSVAISPPGQPSKQFCSDFEEIGRKEEYLGFFNISCVLRVVLQVVLHLCCMSCCMCVACRVACASTCTGHENKIVLGMLATLRLLPLLLLRNDALTVASTIPGSSKKHIDINKYDCSTPCTPQFNVEVHDNGSSVHPVCPTLSLGGRGALVAP